MLERFSTTGDEPVTLAEAKLAAKVDVDDLDLLIPGLIASARKQAEHITGRVYCGGVFRWTGSTWPCSTLPITGVASAAVRRWDGAALVLLDAAAFVCAERADNPGTDVVPALGSAWPDLPSIAAGARVQIDLTVTRTPAEVPEAVKLYIKAQVASWLKNPEALTAAALVRNPLLDGLLDGERVTYL